MTRYLIEVEHENKKQACERAIKVFQESGSHFMTNADWGCADDEHKAWVVVELESKEQARSLVPPLFREQAKIITLQQFGPDTLDQTRGMHAD